MAFFSRHVASQVAVALVLLATCAFIAESVSLDHQLKNRAGERSPSSQSESSNVNKSESSNSTHPHSESSVHNHVITFESSTGSGSASIPPSKVVTAGGQRLITFDSVPTSGSNHMLVFESPSHKSSTESSHSQNDSIHAIPHESAKLATPAHLSTKSRSSVSTISESSEVSEDAQEQQSLESKLLNGSFAEQVAGTINGLGLVLDKIYEQVNQGEVVFKTFKNKMLEDAIKAAVPPYDWPQIEKLVKQEVQIGRDRIENQVANFKIDILDMLQKGLDQLRSDVRQTVTADVNVAEKQEHGHGSESGESSEHGSKKSGSSSVGTYDKYPYGVKHPASHHSKHSHESSESGISADALKRLQYSDNQDLGTSAFEKFDVFATLPSTPLDSISKSLDRLVPNGDKQAIFRFILNTMARRNHLTQKKNAAALDSSKAATTALEGLRRELNTKLGAHQVGSEVFERLEDLTRDQLHHPTNATAESLKQIRQTLIQALRKQEMEDIEEAGESGEESSSRKGKKHSKPKKPVHQATAAERVRKLKEAARGKLSGDIKKLKSLAVDSLALKRHEKDVASETSHGSVPFVPANKAVSNLEAIWDKTKRALRASEHAANKATALAAEARGTAHLLESTTAADLRRIFHSQEVAHRHKKQEHTEHSSVDAIDVTKYRGHTIHYAEPKTSRPVAPPPQLPALESIIEQHQKLLEHLKRPLTWDEKQIKHKLEAFKHNFTVVPEVRDGLERKVLPAVRHRLSPPQTWALHGVEIVDNIDPDTIIDTSGPNGRAPTTPILIAP